MLCRNFDCRLKADRLIHGYCFRCYQAWRKFGQRACSFCHRRDVISNYTPRQLRRLKIVTCQVCLPVRLAAWSYSYDYCQGCRTKNLPHKAQGLCQTCYRRKQLLGGPLACTQPDCKNQTYRNFAAGENVMCADCYNEQGRRIFQLIEQRMPLTKIAEKFRLSTRTIKQILRFYSPGEQSDLPLHHYHVVKNDIL